MTWTSVWLVGICEKAGGDDVVDGVMRRVSLVPRVTPHVYDVLATTFLDVGGLHILPHTPLTFSKEQA